MGRPVRRPSLPLERADIDDRRCRRRCRPSGAGATPRWSVAGTSALSPRSMAGLPASRAWVWSPAVVGERAELRVDGVLLVPTRSPLTPLVKPVLPVPSPMRLWPWLVKSPDTSGPVPPKSTRFWAMIVFLTLNVPPEMWKTPPPVWAMFSAMVQLSSVACAAKMPPPYSPAVLPLTVQLVSVAVMARMPPPRAAGGVAADGAVGQRRRARRQMPPPSPPAVLPLTVQLVSVAVLGVDAAAAVDAGGVAADGAAGQRRRALAKMPPPRRGGVAADGAVGQRRRAGEDAAAIAPAELPLTVQLVSVAVSAQDAAAVAAGGVAADGAVGQRRRAGVDAAAVGRRRSCR